MSVEVAMKSLLRLPFCACCFLLILLSAPLLAQKGGGSGGARSGGVMPNSRPGVGAFPNNGENGKPIANCDGIDTCPSGSTPRPLPATPTNDDHACFLTPIAGIHSPTVSVIRLEVPDKARSEHDKACSALDEKKYPEAEKHLKKAIDVYSDYTAAWVLLAQVQELEQKNSDAAESCNRALKIDSGYAPAYLCLAHLAVGERKWTQVEELTTHLLRLNPINASNAYYYNALAYFHLHQLSSAETSALRGIEDNTKDHQPRLHLLLAEIYEKKGDRSSEISELQEYLKRDPHGVEAAEVSTRLKAIEKP